MALRTVEVLGMSMGILRLAAQDDTRERLRMTPGKEDGAMPSPTVSLFGFIHKMI